MPRNPPSEQEPLRNPGRSIDDELTRLRAHSGYGYLFFTACVLVLAIMEGWGYFFGLPRLPLLFAGLVAIAALATFIQVRRGQARTGRSHLDRDSKRLVEEMLEELRAQGATLFRDVPGDGFNLDQVVISDGGVMVVAARAVSKRGRGEGIAFIGDQLLVDGRRLRRDPIIQLRAQMRWLANLLEQLTGETLPVRGALVLPNCRLERPLESVGRDVWVLAAEALPEHVRQAPATLSAEQISRVTIYLGNFIRRQG